MLGIKKVITKLKTGTPGEPATGQISAALLAARRKAADYLNRKTAGWSPRKAKRMLIVFCLVTGNTCIYITGKAILCANGPPSTFKVQRFTPAAPIIRPGFKTFQPSDSTLKEIQHEPLKKQSNEQYK
jgi:hypothetical protein